MDNNFYERVKARLMASQEGHLDKVVAVATDSETCRKAKLAAQARTRRARMTPEQKKDLSIKKMDQAKANHGEDHFVKVGRKYRQSLKGMRYTRQYTLSDSHRAASRAYIDRKKSEDPEGWSLHRRLMRRKYLARVKSSSLWFMLTSLPDNYFEALLSIPPAPGV